MCIVIFIPFQLSNQLESFQKYLEAFATKHKTDIRKKAQFRSQFQEMCATIGVDPLACEFINVNYIRH